MSEALEDVRQICDDIIRRIDRKHVADAGRVNEVPQKLWDAWVGTGLLGLGLPEEYGGIGGDLTDLVHAIDWQASAGLILQSAIPNFMSRIPVVKYGTEEQRNTILPATATGESRFAFAITEADAGSNTFKIRTTALKQDDGTYRLSGSKYFITGFMESDWCLVVARTTPYDPENRTEGISVFLVRPDSPGISASPMDIGIHKAEKQYSVLFEDVVLPADSMLGPDGEGLKVLFDGLNPERMIVAATNIGSADYVLKKASEYASHPSPVRRADRHLPVGRAPACCGQGQHRGCSCLPVQHCRSLRPWREGRDRVEHDQVSCQHGGEPGYECVCERLRRRLRRHGDRHHRLLPAGQALRAGAGEQQHRAEPDREQVARSAEKLLMAAPARRGVSRDWNDVAEGEEIEGFTLPITIKTLVLAVIGTRDVMPYHHNRDFCHRLGIRDAFVNTAYLQGLLSRCATDWSGPEAVVATMTLTMKDQLCLGDVAVVGGKVLRTWVEGDRHSVEIEVTISTLERPDIASAVIVLDLVANGTAPSPRILTAAAPTLELGDDMPDELRDRLDERVVRHAPFPVSEAQIAYWCDMVQDAHPAYQNFDGGSGQVQAPAASMSIWNLVRAGQLGVTSSAADLDAPDRPSWPSVIESDWPFEWRAPNAREVIVQRRHAEFGAVVRPGDMIHSTAQLLTCSGRRQTKLGEGYFLSRFEVYQNQRDEVIGTTTMSLFQYGIDDEDN